MSSYKYYACGYNGFQQINQCLDTADYDKTSDNGQQMYDSLPTNSENNKETSNSNDESSALYETNDSFDHKRSSQPCQGCLVNKCESFRDISQAQSGSESQDISKQTDSTSCDISHSQSVCLPTLLRLEPVLWTWSQLWTVSPSDCSYSCHGYNSASIMATLKRTYGSIPKPVTQIQGHSVLAKNGSRYMVINENGTVTMVTVDIDDVINLDATKDKIYGTKGNQVYEGQINQSSEDGMGISFSCLTMKVQIDTVSCGFEHTVMMSNSGDVLSLGSGSRGQLGHGEVTVDYQSRPRKIQTLEGICVVAIATGGWHSCAVTDTGDLYVWGWNESGQLGIPNGSTTPSESDCTKSSSVDIQAKCEHCSNQHILHSYGSQKYCENNIQVADLCTDESVAPRAPVQCKVVGHECVCDKHTGEVETKADEQCDSCKCDLLMGNSDCVPIVRKVVEKPVRTKLHQSLDCVQIQTVPYGLEMPDEYSVKKVVCGSRHTCILLDCGSVYTTGWNKYGQLGHGDWDTRDVLEIVSYFTNHHHVVDVKADVWNTFVISEN